MGFLDRLKSWITGDDEPAAPERKPVQGPSQPWPGLGASSPLQKATGAKPANPSTWKISSPGTDKYGTPRAITESMPKEFAAAVTAGPPKPTAAEYQVLKTLGWELPTDAESPTSPESLFKTEDPRTLVSYSYLPEQQEVDRITELYKDMPGYKAPADPGNRAIAERLDRGGYLKEPLEPEPKPLVTQEASTAALTWEAYDALPEDQRAAVDFNTLLVRAREADIGKSYIEKATPEQKEMYNRDVEAMFGKTGGSEKYAPNTVALLKQIDFKAVGQDLDEYLSLERGFTVSELKNFTLKDVPELNQLGDKNTSYATVRSTTNREALDAATVAKSSDAIAKVMTDANQVLGNFYASSELARAGQVSEYGAAAAPVSEAMTGFPLVGEVNEKDQFFQTAYSAATAGRMDEVWMKIQENGLSQADVDELFTYFDQRSADEARYGRPNGLFDNTEGVTYMEPQALRESLGWGG
jgi:hypothetical protein